jgi:RHS repeat-associated protein
MMGSAFCASCVHFEPSISTGKERDTESGNDYFGARYYASSMGRFLSPDPTLRSGHPADPQTWNRYVYGGNNPLKFIDPDGKEKQLVVYVQQPVPGSRTVSTQAGTNYGHAFIGLKDTVSGVEHRIGFYPKSKWDLLGDRSASVPGTLKNDDKSDWTVKKTYTLSDDQFKALAGDINKQLANPEQYNMQTNNCATWVVNEAGAVGINLPQTPGKQDGGSGLDPGDLGQDLRERGTGAAVNPDHDPVGSGSLAPDPPPPPTPKPPPPPQQQ